MKNLVFIFICLLLLGCKNRPIEYAEESPIYLGEVVEINPYGSTLVELGKITLSDSLELVDSLGRVHEKTDSIIASVLIIVDASGDSAIGLYDLK